MVDTVGTILHRKDQKKGIIPDELRNIDITAGWGVFAYRGWVFGHAFDVFVTTGKLVVHVIVLGRSLVIRVNTAVKSIINLLPRVKKELFSADSGCFDIDLDELLQKTGIRLYSPGKRNPEVVT